MSVQYGILLGLALFILWAIQNRVFAAWGLKKIEYTRFFSVPTAFAGDEVQMVERISNHKLLFVPWLELESNIDPSFKFGSQTNLNIRHGQFHRSVFTMWPYMRITRKHRVKCTRRGLYFLDSVALNCCDLLGFSVDTTGRKLSARILVYPRLVSMDDIPLPTHSWQGDIAVRRWIVDDPFMISGVREYRWGDALNHINWSATARTGKLQVHNRDFTADPHLMIYLNFDTSDDMWDAVTNPECIEQGISYAASIAHYMINQGIETGFACNGYQIYPNGESLRIEPRCGRDHFTYILDNMARLVIKRSVSFYTFLEQDIIRGITNTDILIITSYMSDRLSDQIRKLIAMGNAVEILWLDSNIAEGGQ